MVGNRISIVASGALTNNVRYHGLRQQVTATPDLVGEPMDWGKDFWQ